MPQLKKRNNFNFRIFLIPGISIITHTILSSFTVHRLPLGVRLQPHDLRRRLRPDQPLLLILLRQETLEASLPQLRTVAGEAVLQVSGDRLEQAFARTVGTLVLHVRAPPLGDVRLVDMSDHFQASIEGLGTVWTRPSLQQPHKRLQAILLCIFFSCHVTCLFTVVMLSSGFSGSSPCTLLRCAVTRSFVLKISGQTLQRNASNVYKT